VLQDVLDKLERWGQDFVLLLPNIAVALAVLVVAWIVSIVVGKAVSRIMVRVSDQHALNDLVRKLARFAVMAGGFLIALAVLQLEDAAATFLAGAGIVGIALGFAFQDLTANFIAGVVMAIKRPINLGELVETNDQLGVVQRIELRSTWLETLDGKIVMIPNRKVFEGTVTNLSRSGKRRVEVRVGVSYDDDLAVVRRVTVAAVEGVKPRLDNPVELFFEKFGESSIDLVVRFWIAFASQTDYLAAHSAAMAAISAAYRRERITIPYPIRTIDYMQSKAPVAVKGGSSTVTSKVPDTTPSSGA
jgi:small conductance mechanosensitive channel